MALGSLRHLAYAPVAFAALVLAAAAGAACSSTNDAASASGDAGSAAEGDSGASSSGASSSGASSSGASSSGASSSGASSSGGDAGEDAGEDAGGDAGEDGAAPGADAGVPGVLTIGRFDETDPAKPSVAWPGARILARFDGTTASVTLTHLAGSEAATSGNTWINIVVDGVLQAPREISGVSQVVSLTPAPLAAGVHTIEIEKRTEANIGTLRFEGFTFGGGTGLLPPPARPARRIEIVSESTIDGFGVEGNGWDDPATCNMEAPSRYDNARKSLAFYTADALAAEHHLVAFSGKGVARNNDLSTTETMASLWTRTLPESPGSTWAFASWTPEVVVVSLGGADFKDPNENDQNLEKFAPADLGAKYTLLAADIRARYPNAHVFLTIWSQLKDYDLVRPKMTAVVDATLAARQDPKLYKVVLPEAAEAVETGCFFHANDAHHKAMAALLVTQIRAKTGW